MKSETLVIEIDGVEALEVSAVVLVPKKHANFELSSYLVDQIMKAIERIEELQEAELEH